MVKKMVNNSQEEGEKVDVAGKERWRERTGKKRKMEGRKRGRGEMQEQTE